jgi:hypothetical protein
MEPNRQEALEKLDNILSGFLKAYAVKRLDWMNIEELIAKLYEITFSDKPEYDPIDNRLRAVESWFMGSGPKVVPALLNNVLIQKITNSVNHIEALCRSESAMPGNQEPFDRNLALKVNNLAHMFLTRCTGKKELSLQDKQPARADSDLPKLPESGPADGENIKEKFIDSLKYQLGTMEYYADEKYHLLSIVDQLLKNIEQNPDTKANHMAASILYFMKKEGYRVTPYVERLRKANRNNNGR